MDQKTSLRECLKQSIAPFNLTINEVVLTRLEEYFQMLLHARERYNLIGKLSDDGICTMLFADSLLGLKVLPEEGVRVIDTGTGAGFPGMVLRIARPDLHMTFLDAVEKKLDFVRSVAEYLQIDNVTFIQERAELLGRDPRFRESFDVAVTKGFAPMSQLVELCAPLVKEGGKVIAWKGIHYDEEINFLGDGFKLLGLGEPEYHDFKHALHTVLVIFNKTARTPDRFPRSYQAIRKRPLTTKRFHVQ